MAKLKKTAFLKLATRFLSPEELTSYVAPDAKTIAGMVQDFEVVSEQLSTKRYVGIYTFRFKAHAANRYFNRSPRYADTEAAPASNRAGLMILPFFQQGRAAGSFDLGIQKALERMLVSSHFLFRIEHPRGRGSPPRQALASGRGSSDPPQGTPFPITDLELASRLSFFLLNSAPDAELRALAAQGKLRQPAVLRAQTERLLADPMATRFVDAFLDYWLDLRRIVATAPDELLYNDYYLDDLLSESALFESGRPVLLAPQTPVDVCCEKVIIAWNSSTETARTVALSMPLLVRARSVTVLSVEGWGVPGPTGTELAAYLARTGVPAAPRTVAKNGRSPGETVLHECARSGADLLVKGAYTQSRLRQLIFGGATRHIIAHAQLPVILSN